MQKKKPVAEKSKQKAANRSSNFEKFWEKELAVLPKPTSSSGC